MDCLGPDDMLRRQLYNWYPEEISLNQTSSCEEKKHMTKFAYLTLLAAAGLSITGAAQDKSSAPKKSADNAAMSMPKPAPEMKELRGMIGTWTSDEQYEVSPFMPA